MPFSIRLDSETEATIERLAKRSGKSRASVVREAVAKYAAAEQRPQTAYDALRPLIGIVSSGDGTLSQQTGKKFTELLLKKKAERDRRRGPR